MFIPSPRKTATDTANKIFNEFKFSHTLINSNNLVQFLLQYWKIINQVNCAFATMKRVLCTRDILAKLKFLLYDATVINILVLGCKNWALMEELQKVKA